MATIIQEREAPFPPLPTGDPHHPDEYPELPRRRLYATLGALMVTLFLGALDQTIVGVALPRAIADLHGFEHYAWVATAYMLTSTTVVPIVGKLSDIYGQRVFLLGGVASFTAASVLCGFAQDMFQLSLFRGIQGVGAGIIFASVFTVISVLFPPARRAKLQGLFSATFGLASVAGPLLGGYLTDNWTWRWVFLVNLPVGLVTFAVLWFAYANPRVEHRPHKVDYLGAIGLVFAVVPFLLALSWGGREYPWASPQILGLLAFTAVMVALFMLVEMRAPEPILPFDLLRNPVIAVAVSAVALVAAAMFGTVLFVPLFIQAVIGMSASASGTALTPMMLAMVASSIGGGQIVGRTGSYKGVALAGALTATAGVFLLVGMGPDTTYLTVVRNTMLIGLGMGAMMPCFNLAAQNAVPRERLGVVTALTGFLRSIGGTVGVAAMGSLLAIAYGRALSQTLPPGVAAAMSPERLAEVSNPQALLNPEAAAALRQSFGASPTADAVMEAIRLALASSLHDVFFASALLAVFALVVTLFLRDDRLRGSRGA